MAKPKVHAAAVLAARRLTAQQIALHAFTTPREVVTWLGAVQAQDYAAARWAVGVRLPDEAATDASIERAIADGLTLQRFDEATARSRRHSMTAIISRETNSPQHFVPWASSQPVSASPISSRAQS
jgi:hypothetical protein